jgi:hypothetical protein
MNISGQRRLSVPVDQVWTAIHDVAVLRETIPGCRELRQTGPDTYEGEAAVGIAAIKGVYRGSMKLLEERASSYLRIGVAARSGHAEIKGEGSLELAADDGATLVQYAGDARISGPLALVGQRLLPSASKSLTEQFFDNLERRLTSALGSRSAST